MVRLLPPVVLVFTAVVIALRFPLSAAGTPSSQAVLPAYSGQGELAARAEEIFRCLQPLTFHYADLSEAQAKMLAVRDANYERVLREKERDQWFAALLATSEHEPFAIRGRFGTWRGLIEFLAEKGALVEVWACGEAGTRQPRRIPALEWAKLRRQRYERPTVITATYPEHPGESAATYRVEFGFQAAAQVLTAKQAYQRHLTLQLTMSEILGALNSEGLPDAEAQWKALLAAKRDRGFTVLEAPSKPSAPQDLFVAVEYEVDDLNHFRRVLQIYRDSQVRQHVSGGIQCLLLQAEGRTPVREVFAYQRAIAGDELILTANPLASQDRVELRVEDPAQPDPRKWNVLEFGEPKLLKQASLAHFALISAYLERNRKALAMRQANLNLVAEPIIAGLNIGGGLAGVAFPLGAAARLAYDAAVVPWLIPDVPSVKQMRHLLQLLAAKECHPELKTKPAEFLQKEDVRTLGTTLKDLTTTDVAGFLQRIGEEDLRAMLRIAKMERIDAKVVNLLSILADAGKVSGWTDESGVQRDFFNNIYFSMTGEISINYSIAALAGAETVTPLSGVSLYDLARGNGPAEAWLQYFNFTVDFRAVLNTLARLSHRTLADKELKRPFPYAPRLSDLSAYEIRIFGFPVLLFYKRGLIRADMEAYENDYAYGLLGSKIVEHFPSREDLEEEIGAGRLVPLGYVRVPSGKNGWKETNLAVFAHRIPSGKYRGKTSIVIYGLKAYREHSKLIEKERDRFKQYERGLREGAVLEQWAGATSGSIQSVQFPRPESVIHVGPRAAEEIYEPLLASLLELRRGALLDSWGLPLKESEREELKTLRERLAERGIDVAEGNPLDQVDEFNASFRYRRRGQGGWEAMKVTLIPGLSDVTREVEKSEEARMIEEMRHEAATGQTAGVVLVNEALVNEGQFEVGPLLTNHQGHAIGAGVKSGVKALEGIFELVDRLPAVDRMRLEFNHFASTIVELDVDGDGTCEKVFLTIEFPVDEVRRTSRNPLSGEGQTRIYSGGRCRAILTDRRIEEREYDAANIETGSKTYRNLGSQENPMRGDLLEKTQTLEFWFRDLSRENLNPYLPLISKLRMNFVTGQFVRETHGLFPLPIEVVDDQYVTRSRYTEEGVFESARVFENGPVDQEDGIHSLNRILKPTPGRERFRLASVLPQPGELGDTRAQKGQVLLERTDLALGLVTRERVDLTHSGRKVTESLTDPLDGTTAFSSIVTLEYDEDFLHGMIPVRTVTVSSPSGAFLAQATTVGYDALLRRLMAVESDYTGAVRTNTWDYRWARPVEVETEARRTVHEFNRDGTMVRSTTMLKPTLEIVEKFQGHYSRETKTIQGLRLGWYRPEMLSRVETNTYSAGGRLISARVGDLYETILAYAPDGREQSRQTFRRDRSTGRFTLPYRVEDDYRWDSGRRDFRVRIWLEERLWDEYRVVCDKEGRLYGDQIRQWPGLELRTVLTYDGNSDRVAEATSLQNGKVRSIRRTQGEEQLEDGNYAMRLEVIPFWGMRSIHRYRVGDPVGRPLSVEYENGDRSEGLEWFHDTAIPRVSRLTARSGRPLAQWVRSPNVGKYGELPYDQVRRYALNPWGDKGLAEDRGVLRGTDIVLFEDTANERVHFDLSKPFESPGWAIDPHGVLGVPVILSGVLCSNVTAVFRSEFGERRDHVDPTRPPERILDQERIDLLGLFYHQRTWRRFDRTAALLEERSGKIPNPSPRSYQDTELFAGSAGIPFLRRFVYSYAPGWITQPLTSPNQPLCVVFTEGPPARRTAAWEVNSRGWREWPTEIRGLQATTESRIETEGGSHYFFRRLHDPRILRENPHLPGVTNVWTAWTRTELRENGQPVLQAEAIMDALGEVITTIAKQANSRGGAAWRITFRLPLPTPDDWRVVVDEQGRAVLPLNLSGPTDLAPYDFVAFYLDAKTSSRLRCYFRDVPGKTVTVENHADTGGGQGIQFWPVDRAQVQWLPDEFLPVRGSEVLVHPAWAIEKKVYVISVSDLSETGLDVRQIAAIDLETTLSPGETVRISPLYRFAHTTGRYLPKRPKSLSYARETHANGLVSHTRTNLSQSGPGLRRPPAWDSLLVFNGRAVGNLKSSAPQTSFPVVRFVDNADPDSPRPLYAVAAEDGRFLEYYQTVRAGDAQVYTVASGFATPKLEVTRAAFLDDEVSPGVLAFGRGYDITIPLSRGDGAGSSPIADLHNRCVASIFTLAGDRAIELVTKSRPQRTEFRRLSRELGSAESQAKMINELPTLAGALLPVSAVPWKPLPDSAYSPSALTFNTNSLQIELGRLFGKYKVTHLIPTSPGTEVERFVDTVREGSLIQLAVKVRNVLLAKDLLTFYAERSGGGRQLIHNSYDAKTGVPLGKELRYKRPGEAIATAEAQLAIAEAAFCLSAATGDQKAFQLGKNLINLTLNHFQSTLKEVAWPRGIAERSASETIDRYGIVLWPKAKFFSLQTNARAFLLLKKVGELLEHYPSEVEWKEFIRDATAEQAAWLNQRILPHVQRTGIVPKGLFEVQDVHTRTTALAVEPWTSAEDWLTFLEACDGLGVNRGQTLSWLENLTRVHGVSIDGVWGLDWSIPLHRPDAISPGLMAKFLRIANLLGHRDAAVWAQRNLHQLRNGERWPAAFTSSTSGNPFPSGQGFDLYPAGSSVGGSEPDSQTSAPWRWPEDLGVHAELLTMPPTASPQMGDVPSGIQQEKSDFQQFVWVSAGFYMSVLVTAVFWWGMSAFRKRRNGNPVHSESLVPDAVMQRAEERWAKRVLGLRCPPGLRCSRYSNGSIEQNFYMQLRASYKLVLEWRRLVHGWPEGGDQLVEEEGDEWLNGMDEFAVVVGVFSRWVVKAGRKDGCRKPDVLEEHEDSNHIWSRLVMYFSEWHPTLLGLLKEFKANPQAGTLLGVSDQIELVLRTMGVRARPNAFDARLAFDFPNREAAFDMLLIQLPGTDFTRIAQEMERRLGIPYEHTAGFVRTYKSFKQREQVYPVHAYLLETAKLLPHFVLVGLVALIWYNDDMGGVDIIPTLKELAVGLLLDWPKCLIWAGPLASGLLLNVTAYFLEVYRYRWSVRAPRHPRVMLDAPLSSFFAEDTRAATPAIRPGRWWNPVTYRYAGWLLRSAGLVFLVSVLLQFEAPNFTTFMFIKGTVALFLLAEAAGILLPIIISRFSMWLEDWTSENSKAGIVAKSFNQLNLVATRPASLLWLSFRYYFQPSVPTGGVMPMLHAILFYLLFGATLFFVGGYLYRQALEFWFQETYRNGRDLSLIAGGFFFWNTMYLLRFGVFVLFTSLSSALARFPFRVLGGLIGIGWLGFQLVENGLGGVLGEHLVLAGSLLTLGLLLMVFEAEVLAWLNDSSLSRRLSANKQAKEEQSVAELLQDPTRALGVVYMSGDDLSFHKLTSRLLMARLRILRDQLDSGGLRLISLMHGVPDDATLSRLFTQLHELEQRYDVTLWHPLQLVTQGQKPVLRPELGLSLVVENCTLREQLLAAWHIRRWLVTMMSTAGHSQDTGINLVDFAVRLAQDGLGPNTVFYLIQNKYDNGDNNRPSQLAYGEGELAQREKLAALLMEVAPGSRAYCVNDWTPFGFKAGGLVGMDLVYEESLKLTNMLILDRNATAHDLDSVVADLRLALSDPGVVIVIPGRSTTNTLTPIGQSSQLVEEGQRAWTRGVMLLGGASAETLGTGWGNIQAVYYGRVQRALCDPDTPIMPLTTPGRRNAAFGDRFEGMIGFGPHAVGISEDIWGVTQAAHNALALGYRVTFRRSKTLWHKMRESWSHAEWFTAFPRWSGGYLQMMMDPIMQRINDDGPVSVFAKELRANGGRFFLGAPAALLSILLMPLAILLDTSPFVQVLILLWNLGLAMNQVLTALGLISSLESKGFNRVTAGVGITLASVLAATMEGLVPFLPVLMVLGCLVGGFADGIGDWLYHRGRDMILFGPQLVIHTLGQVMRQSLEFLSSGASPSDAQGVNIAFRAWAGPREDRPGEGYQSIVNLRTVVWGVGLVSLVLNLFALTRLDFLNVLLLLPSLLFSVSTLIGPFIMHPKRGQHMGWSVWIPKLLGWVASFGLYCLLAWLVAQGGWQLWLGAFLFVSCFARVLAHGLKYFLYPWRLRYLVERLVECMISDGKKAKEAANMAKHIVCDLGAEVRKTSAFLGQAGLSPRAQDLVMHIVQDRLEPFLKKPIRDLTPGRWSDSRFMSECKRSFVLGLFTFLWFFIVPIPGLLVLTVPGGYRATIPLGNLISLTAFALGLVLMGRLTSLFLDWWHRYGWRGRGLVSRIQAQYQRFRTLGAVAGQLSAVQIASLYALFTDAQTYVDQGGYAFARQTLGMIQKELDSVPGQTR